MAGWRLELAHARLEDLATLRDFVSRACAAVDAPAGVAEALALATDEVCTNVIQHGYSGAAPGPITITLDRRDADVVVTVSDRGRPFDPATVPLPDIAAHWPDRPLGGLGLYLARRMVDEMRYESDAGGGNRLTLIKRLGDRASVPPPP